MNEERNEEKDIYEKYQSKINNTKSKLEALCTRLQENPPKRSITKKLLRLQIGRLRRSLDRNMAKFDIEYNADLAENEGYEKFISDIRESQKEIYALEEEQDKLEEVLAKRIKKENFRGTDVRKLNTDLKMLAPKNYKGK